MPRPVEIPAASFPSLAQLSGSIPPLFEAFGDLNLLLKAETAPLGLFCSQRCPPELQAGAHQLSQLVRDSKLATISGFFTPVETEMFDILLRGTQPVIRVEVRGLEGYPIPNEFKRPLEKGRLLLLSPYPGRRKPDKDLAEERNRIVAALASRLVVIHAEPGGKLERLCAEAAKDGQKPVEAPDSLYNAQLGILGVKLVRLAEFSFTI